MSDFPSLMVPHFHRAADPVNDVVKARAASRTDAPGHKPTMRQCASRPDGKLAFLPVVIPRIYFRYGAYT